jgi:hypothetical protein
MKDKGSTQTPAQKKQERLAKALKDNLKKRKEQMRARETITKQDLIKD